MMGRHAPESYRTTNRGQTPTPENPPGGSGDFFWGAKRLEEERLESNSKFFLTRSKFLFTEFKKKNLSYERRILWTSMMSIRHKRVKETSQMSCTLNCFKL